MIELVENEEWHNKKIEGQIKGTRKPTYLQKGDVISFPIDVKTVNYGLGSNVAYVLFVADVDEEKVYYLDASVLNAGDVLYKTDSQETYTVSKRASLIGVYNMNKGYADFKEIMILYQNDEYAIVKANTRYGLNVYDYIVLEANSVIDDQFINE